MNRILRAEVPVIPDDRPGWIPADILCDWNTDPYAYQTEEELMPAGGLHGQLLAYIMEILRDFIRSEDMMMLMDTFMLYRDCQGVRQRVAPDLLLMQFRPVPPSAYDLDIEPPPLFVAEVTSPDSHLKDLESNVSFYAAMGVPAYLAIDAVTPGGKPREQIALHLWRSAGNLTRRVRPDAEGWLPLPEMGVRVRARGQKLIFSDMATGEILKDTGGLRRWAKTAEQNARADRRRAEAERQRAEAERQRAEMAEEKLRCLMEQCRAMGIDPSFPG